MPPAGKAGQAYRRGLFADGQGELADASGAIKIGAARSREHKWMVREPRVDRRTDGGTELQPAEAAGISQVHLAGPSGEIEGGDRGMGGVDTVARLAEVLNVRVDDLSVA